MFLRFTLVLALLAFTPQVGDGADAPVLQPGSFFQTAAGTGCTVGFLLDELDDQGTDTGVNWFLTAGHCFLGETGSMTWIDGDGPAAFAQEEQVGTAVHAARDWLSGVDVAAVRLTLTDEQVVPSVCYWGGPTAIAANDPDEGDTLLMTGRGAPVRPREVAATADQQMWIQYRGHQAGGDSGAPILTEDGQALGIHALGGLHLPDLSTGSASKLPNMLALVEEAVGVDLELSTAARHDTSWPADLLDHDCSNNLAVP